MISKSGIFIVEKGNERNKLVQYWIVYYDVDDYYNIAFEKYDTISILNYFLALCNL